MTRKEYNGWTNYETWVVHLWLTNDEGSQNYWSEIASDVWDREEDDDHATRCENARRAVADMLQEHHEEAAGEAINETAGLWCDLINAALSDVNWGEIAGVLLEDVDEYEGELKAS